MLRLLTQISGFVVGVLGTQYMITGRPDAPGMPGAPGANRMLTAGLCAALIYFGSRDRTVIHDLSFSAGIGGVGSALLLGPIRPYKPAKTREEEEEENITKQALEAVKAQTSQLGCATCRMPADTVRESLEGCMPCMAAAMLADQYSDEELLTNSATMFNV